MKETKPGQINAFFRWKTVADTKAGVEVSLFLIKSSELKTSFTIPQEATADVSLRRLQQFSIKPEQVVKWSYGSDRGEAKADKDGVVTIPKLKVSAEAVALKIE